MENKTLLEAEIKNRIKALSGVEMGSEYYKTGVDSVTKLLDRSIEMERLEVEREEKARMFKAENELKLQQMAEERKDRWIKNGISIGSIVVPTVLAVWGTFKTLKFEETGTVTTIMGRGFINKLLPKK